MRRAVPQVVSVVVFLSACGGGGGDGSEQPGGGGQGSLRLDYAAAPSDLAPGELLHVRVVSGGVADAAFAGTLSDTVVSPVVDAAATDLTLIVAIPPVSPGDHKLTIAQGMARGELPLYIAPYTPIAAPAAYVTTTFEQADGELATLLADEPEADGRAFLEEKRAAIASAKVQAATLSSAELSQLAYIFRDIEEHEADGTLWRSNFPECPAAETLVTSVQAAALGAGVFAFAGAFSLANPIAAPVAARGASLLARGWASAWRSVGRIMDECLDVERIFADGAQVVGKVPWQPSPTNSAATAPLLVFQHGISKFIPLDTEFSMRPELAMVLDEAKSALDASTSPIPASWRSAFDVDYHGPINRAGPPKNLVVTVVPFNCGMVDEFVRSATGVTGTLRFIHELQCPPASSALHLYFGTPDATITLANRREAVLEPVCEAPLSVCTNDWNACYDLQNDDKHCGTCETSCMTGSFNHPNCVQGTCSCALQPGTIMCGVGSYAGNCTLPEHCN